MKRLFWFFLLLTLSVSVFAEMVFLPTYPFKIGEKMLLTINVLGIYIGDQVINVEDLIFTNGRRVVVGSGHLYTTPFMSSFYKVDDTERTWFIPENFVPFYYERWINEGNWKDHILFNFFPEQHKVVMCQKVNNYAGIHVSYKNVLRNYFTLISTMRSVDYDYHIQNKVPVEIDYLFGTTIKTARFKPFYKKERFNNQYIDVIYLEEIGGIGMHFYISKDGNRTPLRLVIPAFEVIGFKTISVYVELKEYTPGDREIVPLSMIPSGAFDSVAPAKEETPATNATVGTNTVTNTKPVTNTVKKTVKKAVSSSSTPKKSVSSSSTKSSVKTTTK